MAFQLTALFENQSFSYLFYQVQKSSHFFTEQQNCLETSMEPHPLSSQTGELKAKTCAFTHCIFSAIHAWKGAAFSKGQQGTAMPL